MNHKKKAWLLGVCGVVSVVLASALHTDFARWTLHYAVSGGDDACGAAQAPTGFFTVSAVPNHRATVQRASASVVGVSRLEEVARAAVLGTPAQHSGSGFVISADGLILTAAHWVGDARVMAVRLYDRREYEASVLGVDTTTNIAVLRIDAPALTAVLVESPPPVQVGDPVLTMGAPYGLEPVSTQGMVSGLGRSLPGSVAVPFIQTDTAASPGSAGGPLFDGGGSVVGIMVQAEAASTPKDSMALAIPMAMALKVARQIVATGRASHSDVGVVVEDMNPARARSLGMKRPDGAFVADVAPDSAAARAGLRAGDVLTAVNGACIADIGDLSKHIAMAVPGDSVRLSVWRNQAADEMVVRLEEAIADTPKPSTQALHERPPELDFPVRLPGPLTRVAPSADGLLAETVAGLRARIGMQPGDVLLAINGIPVNSILQAQRVMLKNPRAVQVLIQRKGERIVIPLELI
jgi:serine protease Do